MTDTLDTVRFIGATPGTAYSAQIPLMVALDNSYSDDEREFAIGRHHGLLVGIGLEAAATLRAAEATPFADRQDLPQLLKRAAFIHWLTEPGLRSQVIAASGVLVGYWEATVNRPDAEECFVCGRRICVTLDDYTECMCGVFCPLDCDENANHTTDCQAERAFDEASEWAVDYALDDMHGAS